MKVKAYRTRKNAKLPIRAHNTDAGMDFFYCPPDDVSVTLPPNTATLLETGVKIQVPAGFMLQVMNKSGIASKKFLITGACVVDEGYTGEIFVNLHNIGQSSQTITAGQKIAQGVFVKIERPTLFEIEEDNIYGHQTSRSDGALGSTGIL